MVLDPIINGYRLTRVLMDSGSSLNFIYEDTVRRMRINHPELASATPPLKG